MNFPDDRRYTENNLWLRKTGEEVFELGLVKPAVEAAKQFMFMELKEEGKELEKGDLFAEYEALKRIGELATPVKAEIVEVNDEVADDPGKLIEEPYENWLVKLETAEEPDLMEPGEAEEYYEKQV